MLHIINKSPLSYSSLGSCLRFALKDDNILFYEDGVLGVKAKNKLESVIKEAMEKYNVYALQEDLKARGIVDIIDGVKVVDYSGFVELVEENKVNSWL